MGYDVERFKDTVDEELLCPICKCVYQNPYRILPCDHTFCLKCIKTWCSRSDKCPIDGQNIASGTSVKEAPRILRNLLSRLQIQCDFAEHGCKTIVKLDLLPAHVKNCSFDPKKLVECYKGCGARIRMDENTSHNCLRDLRIKFESLEAKVKVLENAKCQHCNCSPVPQPGNRNTSGVPSTI